MLIKFFFKEIAYVFCICLFLRMEETVRNLLQSQGPPEQKKEEAVNIMVYQVCHVSYSWLGTSWLVFLVFLWLCPP